MERTQMIPKQLLFIFVISFYFFISSSSAEMWARQGFAPFSENNDDSSNIPNGQEDKKDEPVDDLEKIMEIIDNAKTSTNSNDLQDSGCFTIGADTRKSKGLHIPRQTVCPFAGKPRKDQ
jgi:hypothetical protein